MGLGTRIEWTEATWNPIRARLLADPARVGWHCEHASPGCANCYAEGINRDRFGTRLPYKPGHRKDIEVFADEAVLMQPLRWRRPRQIFVCSMTDLFADFVTDEMIDRVFAVMALCQQHKFQVLTKRSARMREYMAAFVGGKRGVCHAATAMGLNGFRVADAMAEGWGAKPPPNVWLGCSVEDQQRADERIPDLLATPAAIRWLSCEPLLGAVDVRQWLHDYGCSACGYGGPVDERCRECGWHGSNTHQAGPCPQCGELLQDDYACPKCGEPDGEGDFGPTISGHRLGLIDWIVAGGESGRGARPMEAAWARSLRDQCQAAGVPFFFKQWGEYAPTSDSNGPYMMHVGKKAAGRMLDGHLHDAMPPVPA